MKTTTRKKSWHVRTRSAKREAILASERAALLAAMPKWKPAADERHRIGYARVSMDDQTNARQIAALVEAGVHPDDVYTDTASGKDMDRPGWEACWKDLRDGDILVVQSIDRLGRSLGQLALTLEAIHAKGADLHVTQFPIDLRSPIGRFMFGQLASFAEFERLYINERTLDGLKRARERGRFGGAKPKHSDEQILAWHDELGGTGGAKAAGMSKSGFLKAVDRAKLRIITGAGDD
jgi:hypothetical protein